MFLLKCDSLVSLGNGGKMAPDYEYHNDLNVEKKDQHKGALDMLQRDRFELLSAYLDGEVTAQERRQVQQWLTEDPVVQDLYARLLEVRQGLQTMTVPVTAQSVDVTVKQIFAKINQRRTLWGCGSAIAALFIGCITGVIPGTQSLKLELANLTSKPAIGEVQEPLMVALNRPVIEIPKAAVANPIKPMMKIQVHVNSAH